MLHNASQWPTSTLRSMDDRSSTLRPDARSIDANTARSSLDRHSTAKPNAGGLDRLKEGALPTRSLVALSTPHDHVLERMYSHPRRSQSALALPLPSSLDARHPPLRVRSKTGGSEMVFTQARILNEPANSGEGPLGVTPPASSASNTLPVPTLYDPFDGSPLGTVLPPEAPTHEDGMSVHIEGSNEELWAHLSRVLDLQKQIARMHVDMEGLGQGKQTDGKGKGAAFAFPRATSTGSEPEHEIGDEEGVGVVDEEAEKLRARESEFKKLATQFEGRKEAINEVMSKLDDLSDALTEFHHLQAPKIEFRSTSRNNSADPSYGEQPQIHARSQSGTSSFVNTSDSSVRSPPAPKPTPAFHFQPMSHVHTAISAEPDAEGQLLIPSLGRKESMVLPLIIEPEFDSPARMVDSPLSIASLKLPSENNPQ